MTHAGTEDWPLGVNCYGVERESNSERPCYSDPYWCIVTNRTLVADEWNCAIRMSPTY